MLSYLKGSIRPEISIYVQQCEILCNTPRLVHDERAVRRITKHLTSMSTYTDLQDGNGWLSTFRLVYRPDKEK